MNTNIINRDCLIESHSRAISTPVQVGHVGSAISFVGNIGATLSSPERDYSTTTPSPPPLPPHDTCLSVTSNGANSMVQAKDVVAPLAQSSQVQQDFFQMQSMYAALQKTYSETALRLRAAQTSEAQLQARLSATTREKTELRNQLNGATAQRDQCVKEVEQQGLLRLKIAQQLQQSQEENQAALAEYAKVMAERDDVHHELDTLSEQLAQALHRAESAESHVKTLQRCNLAPTSQLEAACAERDVARLERAQAMEERDRLLHEAYELRRADESGVGATSAAVHEFKQLQSELKDVKQQRDQALRQRQTIVDERESIRVLCDRMRKERDQTITRLADVIRDLDHLRVEHADVQRQFKELKEQYDVLCDVEMRRLHLHTIEPVVSRDSAIEHDIGSMSLDSESETLDVEVVSSGAAAGAGLGLELITSPIDGHVYVAAISRGSVADGHLQVLDQLIRVGSIELRNDPSIVHKRFEQVQQTGGGKLQLTVRRRKQQQHLLASTKTVRLSMASCDKLVDLVDVALGLFVSKIRPGADACALQSGDRILSIGGKAVEPIDSVSLADIQRLLHEPPIDSNVLEVVVARMMQYRSCTNLVRAANTTIGITADTSIGLQSPDSARWTASLSKSPTGCWSQDGGVASRSLLSCSSDTPGNCGNGDARQLPQAIHLLKKDNLLDRAVDKIMSRFKTKKEKKKKLLSTSNQSDDDPEALDAILELDSVINAYPMSHTHQNSGGSSSGRGVYLRDNVARSTTSWSALKYATVHVENDVQLWAARAAQEAGRALGEEPTMKSNGQTSRALSDYRPDPCAWNAAAAAGCRVRERLPIPASYRNVEQNSAPNNTVLLSASENSKQDVSNSRLLLPLDPLPPPQFIPLHQRPNSAPGQQHQKRRKWSVEQQQQLQQQRTQPKDHQVVRVTPPPGNLKLRNSNSTQPLFVSFTTTDSLTPTPTMSTSLMVTGSSSMTTNANHIPSSNGAEAWQAASYSPRMNSLPRFHTLPDKLLLSCSGGTATDSGVGAWSGHAERIRIPSSASVTSAASGTSMNSNHKLSLRRLNGGGHGGGGAGGGTTGSLTSDWDSSRYQQPKHLTSSKASAAAAMVSSRFVSGATMTDCNNDQLNHCESLSPFLPTQCASMIKEAAEEKVVLPIELAPRRITLSKGGRPLGIKIRACASGGILIDSIQEDGIAERAGLFVGDQILEFCGINLRKAEHHHARQVLNNCKEDDASILVIYNPREVILGDGNSSIMDMSHLLSRLPPPTTALGEKIRQHHAHQNSNSSSAGSVDTTKTVSAIGTSASASSAHIIPSKSFHPSSVGSCTPTNSPFASFKAPADASMNVSYEKTNSLLNKFGNSNNNRGCSEEPRWVFISRSGHSNLGFTFVGGAQIGILVSDVQANGLASGPGGLRLGDLLLQFNGVDFRGLTAEQAALEMARPSEDARILVQNQLQKFKKMKELSVYDGFYIRTLVDWETATSVLAGTWPPPELLKQQNASMSTSSTNSSSFYLPAIRFQRDAVLLVESTLPIGQPAGCWRAWLLDEHGVKLNCGVIPSARRWDAILAKQQQQQRTLLQAPYLSLASGVNTTMERRASRFKRKSLVNVANMTAERDLNDSTSLDMNTTSSAHSIVSPPYIRLECFFATSPRPVVLLGPMSDAIMAKLCVEQSELLTTCSRELRKTCATLADDLALLECTPRYTGTPNSALQDIELVEVISVAEVRRVTAPRHCLLDILPNAIEKLRRSHIFPLVLFIRFRNAKQLREVREVRYCPDKMTSRQAKEQFERYQQLEMECRPLITAMLQGGAFDFVCSQVLAVVAREQCAPVWLPCGQA